MATSSASTVAVLRFVRGKYQGQDLVLEPHAAAIAGRSSDADLVLADDLVSRKHARFHTARGRVWVRDLGSRNGTLVNGKPVLHQCLRPGDRIAMGSSLARLEVKDPSEVGPRAGEPRRRRAHEVGRSMSGSIEEIPLMDVLQWLATSRKTGCLKVGDDQTGRAGALHLREGTVYYAEISGQRQLHPEKALLRMLLWEKGMFELENTAIENPPIELEMPLEHMLMEAARQQDELANLGKRVPLPSYGQAVTLVRPGPIRWSKLAEAELELVQDMIEAGGWWEAIDGSATDDVTMTRLLVALRDKGVVTY